MIATLKRLARSNDRLYAAMLSAYMTFIFRPRARARAKAAGLSIAFGSDHIDVRRGDDVIRSSWRHAIYTYDIIDTFDFFHGAVHPERVEGRNLVDYSRAREHWVHGYDRHPIVFPSIAEPVATTRQYLDFARLHDGGVAIDLGAYSGLTSILFREACGDTGRVVAVDADAQNLKAARANFAAYRAATGREVDLVEAAVWTHNDGITFSSEGSMGSSATDIVGARTGAGVRVPSMTLSELARRCELDRVDFIKSDIEGAEAVIFGDADFFARFRPRMIVEVHPVAGRLTTDQFLASIADFRYAHRIVRQDGVDLPLLECWPQEAAS